jgi:hypothetical protein
MRAWAKNLHGPLLLCLFVPLLFAICNPFFEIGVNDEWAYVGMARSFAETGRIQMNGWIRAMALPQTVWGGLAIKIAGFSFEAVRASMIPIVLGCCAFVYAIAKWLGLRPWAAALTACELLFCPLFLPLAMTFMSEVPSLLLVLMTLYCVLRAVDAPSRSAVMWIALAAVAGFLAGADRQIMWIAPVAMLGCLIVLRRREREVVLASFIAMVCVVAAAAWIQIWFSRHGILGVPAWPRPVLIAQRSVAASFRIVLTASLYCLPALLLAFGSRVALTRRAWLAIGAAAALLIAIAIFKSDWLRAPWLGNIVTAYGMLFPGQTLAGRQPLELSRYVTHGVGLVVTALTMFGVISLPAIRRALAEREGLDNRLWNFAVIAGPFCVLYFAGSLFSAFWPPWYFDRYLLPLIAIVNLAAMAVAARLQGTALRFAAVPVLLIFGVYGLAMTHDAFRLYEARARAGDRLRRIGVPRTWVSGGYEYDGWTELATAGGIRNAGLAYEIESDPPTTTRAKDFWFLRLTPSVHPRYFVVSSPQADLARTIFAQPYRTWLSPRRREILVQADSSGTCE